MTYSLSTESGPPWVALREPWLPSDRTTWPRDVIAEIVKRNSVPPDQVDDVVWGAANQAGEDNRNVARMAALLAGLAG